MYLFYEMGPLVFGTKVMLFSLKMSIKYEYFVFHSLGILCSEQTPAICFYFHINANIGKLPVLLLRVINCDFIIEFIFS